jgi:hypothetical protein
MRILLFIATYFTLAPLYAQEITVEDQNIAFNYIETSQQLIVDLNQIMLNNNQLTLNSPKEEEKLKAERKKLADQAAAKIAAFSEQKKPTLDFALRDNSLAYAKMMNKILLKDMNLFYVKAGNEKNNCDKCLQALKSAYKLQMEDYKIADQHYDKMNESLDKVAEKHLIDLQTDDSENEKVDKMREAVDYTMIMNIGMQLAVESYNRLAKSFQKIIQNKLAFEAFEKMEKTFKSDLSKVKSYMENMSEEERAFYGDKSLWDAAHKFLDNLKEIEKTELANLKELIKKFKNKEKPEKEKLNASLAVFAKTGGLAKGYEKSRVKFLNGEFK